MIQIIKDKDTWSNVLKSFDAVDFYHTYDYHVLDGIEHDRPILILYSNDDKKIALPLLLRPTLAAYFAAMNSNQRFGWGMIRLPMML